MNASNLLPKAPKRIGIAADHGGYELKEYLAGKLREAGHEVVDFGDGRPKVDDDYPDFIVPLARAVASGKVERGVGVCGSGVGASTARICRKSATGNVVRAKRRMGNRWRKKQLLRLHNYGESARKKWKT